MACLVPGGNRFPEEDPRHEWQREPASIHLPQNRITVFARPGARSRIAAARSVVDAVRRPLWVCTALRRRASRPPARRLFGFSAIRVSPRQGAISSRRTGLIEKAVREAEKAILAVCLSQPGFRDWWEHGKQDVTPEFSRMMETGTSANLVLYDPETRSWNRPEGGRFAQEATVVASDAG